MKQRVWCVAEAPVCAVLCVQLRAWGWDPQEVPLPAATTPVDGPLLPEAEREIERWAQAVLHRTHNHPAPVLIFAPLNVNHPIKSHGYLLAERMWCQRVSPVVLAIVDPQSASRIGTRRVRVPDGFPVVETAFPGETVLDTDNPPLVLWDILSGSDTLQQAIHTAVEAIQPDAYYLSLRNRLLSSLLLEQTSATRHRIKNLESSLRILEGGYLKGWISSSELKQAFQTMISRSPAHKAYLQQLCDQTLGMPMPAPQSIPEIQTSVWICDDHWKEEECWDAVLKPLFHNALGIPLKNITGFETRAKLRQALAVDANSRTEVLLHDVHFDGEGEVTASYLSNMAHTNPLLNVILFTSEIEDGPLVRAAYENGYRIFFKQLNEKNRRDTAAYADKLVDMVRTARMGIPIRALYSAVHNALPQLELVDRDPEVNNLTEIPHKLLAYLKVWYEKPAIPAALLIAPLVENQLKGLWWRRYHSSLPLYGTGIDWHTVHYTLKTISTTECGVYGHRAGVEWIKIHDTARECRNFLAHDLAENVVVADRVLPQIGLILPMVSCIVALYWLECGLRGMPLTETDLMIRSRGLQQLIFAIRETAMLPQGLNALLAESQWTGENRSHLHTEICDRLADTAFRNKIARQDLLDHLQPKMVEYAPLSTTTHPCILQEIYQTLEIASLCLLSV